MKITDNALTVLKNFSTINTSVMVREGNMIATISPSKTIFAKAELDMSFPKDFAIYDIPRFLGALSLISGADIDIGDNFATIKDGSKEIVYLFAEPDTILTADPSKKVTPKTIAAEFVLDKTNLSLLLKAAAVMSLPEISVKGDGKTIIVCAEDSKLENENGARSDGFSLRVGETDKTFNAIFKLDNIRLINGVDYKVIISQVPGAGIFETVNDVIKITYFVPMESNSSFE